MTFVTGGCVTGFAGIFGTGVGDDTCFKLMLACLPTPFLGATPDLISTFGPSVLTGIALEANALPADGFKADLIGLTTDADFCSFAELDFDVADEPDFAASVFEGLAESLALFGFLACPDLDSGAIVCWAFDSCALDS